MIILYPAGPREDGGALVIYTGTAQRSVAWSLTGSGSLTPITTYTDHNGQAGARYAAAPGTAGERITITVSAGA